MKSYQVKVRRDAHTITPVVVPEHEIPVLQTLFGPENVQTVDGKPVEEVGLSEADVAGEFTGAPETEFDRLTAKYGGNEEGVIVEQVYGKKASRGLEIRIERNLKQEAAEKEAAEKEAADIKAADKKAADKK